MNKEKLEALIIQMESQWYNLLNRELDAKLAGNIQLSLHYTNLRERNLAMRNHFARKLETK